VIFCVMTIMGLGTLKVKKSKRIQMACKHAKGKK